MSRILADKVTNYNNDGPFEAEKGINIPLARPLQVSGNAGVSGQYLASTGVGLTWETFPELFSGNYADLTNKPTLFSGSYNDLSNKPAILNINLGVPVSNQYLKFNGSQWINADLPPIYEYDISTSYNPSNQRVGIILSDQFSTQSAVSIYGDNGITVATDVNENIVITSPVVSEYDPDTAKDDVSVMFTNGTNTGISYTYNPATKTISSSVDLAEQLVYTLYGSSPAANSAKIYLNNGTTESGAVTLVGTNGIDISWNVGESKITFSKDDPDPYVLPPATTSSLGGIIPDASDFTIDGNGNLTVNFPASGISLTSLSVAPEAVPSGNGALSYDNTTGQFTYTPPSFSINDLTDVTISAVPEQNALLQWKGTYWDYVSIYNLGLKLDDLSEVGDLSTASDYQVLQRIGNQWVAGNIYLGNQSIHYLDDVGMGKSTNPTMNIEEDSVLAWNNGSSTWEVKKLKLEDFDVSGQATNGQVLVWNGTNNNWVPTTFSGGGGSSTLDGLTDVDVSGAAPGDYLGYNGTSWISVSNPAGIQNLSELSDVSDAAASSGYVLTWNSTSLQWEPAVSGASPGAGLTSRVTRSATTASIADGVYDAIDINGFKSYSLMKIQTSAAAWVTLYCDDASRVADVSRPETTDPTPGAGVIAEVITTGAQTILMTPTVIGFNNDVAPGATIYAKVVNKSGSTQTITVTLTLLQLEA